MLVECTRLERLLTNVPWDRADRQPIAGGQFDRALEREAEGQRVPDFTAVRIRRESDSPLVAGQMHEARGYRLHPVAVFWTFGNREDMDLARQTMDLAVRSPIMRW